MWVDREKKRLHAQIEENNDESTGKIEQKQKVAYNFMQRYYHRGAFYQQDDMETGDADLAESAKQLHNTLA